MDRGEATVHIKLALVILVIPRFDYYTHRFIYLLAIPKIMLDLMLVALNTYAILKTVLQKSKNQLIVGVKLSLSILVM